MRDAMIGLCAGLAALIAAPFGASAQTAPELKSPQAETKAIGVASTTKPEIVPSLIVMNSHGATLQGGKLTLTNVSPNVIIFADRPVRSAGHALTAHFLEEWDPVAGADSFAKDPPNATVSAFDKEASTVKDAVVELTSPKMDGADSSSTSRCWRATSTAPTARLQCSSTSSACRGRRCPTPALRAARPTGARSTTPITAARLWAQRSARQRSGRWPRGRTIIHTPIPIMPRRRRPAATILIRRATERPALLIRGGEHKATLPGGKRPGETRTSFTKTSTEGRME